MSMTNLTAEDVEFLTNLANELKTQNSYGTRKPIFYQVREPYKEWGIDLNYADDKAIIIGDEYDTYLTVDDAKEALTESYLDVLSENETNELLAPLNSFDDVVEFCNDRDIPCFIGGYRNSYRYHQAFLTKSGFDQHMNRNGHNYSSEASLWIDHVFRNPELERLIEIVEKFATVEAKAE